MDIWGIDILSDVPLARVPPPDKQRYCRHEEYRWASWGGLTAAAVLSEFVNDVPWAHLDIAGTAWLEAHSGGSGFGVATLVQLAHAMRG